LALSRDAGPFTGAAGPFSQGLRPGRFVLGLAASAVFAAVFLSVTDTADFERSVGLVPERPGVIALMALAFTAAFGLRALAWRLLLSHRIEIGRLFSILQAGLFINHVMPFKAGELARPYFAVRHGVPVAEAASTTVVARLIDFAALALIATLALPLGALSPVAGVALSGASLAILSGGIAVLWLRHSLPGFLPAVVRAPMAQAQEALRQIHAPQLVVAAGLAIASWLLEGTVLYGAASLLDIDVTLRMAVAATAFTILFQAIHITPGGLGVYETSMTSILALQGVPAETALTLAVVTHGLKFAYSFAVGGPFFAVEAVGALRGTSEKLKTASKLEIVVARGWNVINEGKPFTPVFTLGVLLLLSLPKIVELSYWPGFVAALVAITPLGLLFFRFDFPLRLRWALWAYLGVFLVLFRTVDVAAVASVIGLYVVFTVFVWGTVYYHLRIGTRWTNFLRFWRLVLENPDPTSGNLQEQLPKVLILVMAVRMLAGDFSATNVLGVELFTAVVAVSALLVHRWFFTWVPPLPQPLAQRSHAAGERVSKRFIAIVIDGCRADRLREANTPFIDRLRAEGTEYTNVATVYPARTVTCFSSMLTGASPLVHGMRSNFVPSLGVKCDSIFSSLERGGLEGKLVGIAHLIDAFGHTTVRSVTAVMHNDEIDDGLVARGKEVMTAEEPDVLILQLLSVDQTGHARGSYNDEYLRKIEATDQKIEAFLGWCEARGYLEDATVLITADHGQGIGIGGHGHMSPTEIPVPCILWGKGVGAGVSIDEPRFVTDIAATIAHYMGVENPEESVGEPLLPKSVESERPLVYVIPAYNEEANLPEVLASIRASAPWPHEVVVVDDGSRDETGRVARESGAIVVRHETNRGLGAALRTGLARARLLDARAAVYLDADGEYDAAEVQRLLDPIEAGEADYVLGTRTRADAGGMTFSRRAANRGFSLLTSALTLRWLSDGQTGFRAFSRRALDVAEIVHDYNYAQVLTMDLLHKGLRLAQVPVSYRRRATGSSFITPRYLWKVPLGMAREVIRD
jgi:uncharacterized membrane protein YbhN (UPF0104 family)